MSGSKANTGLSVRTSNGSAPEMLKLQLQEFSLTGYLHLLLGEQLLAYVILFLLMLGMTLLLFVRR